MLKISQIWKNILLETEAKTTTLAYDLYINTLEPIGIYHDRLILLAETRALKNIVNNNYKDVLRVSAKSVFPSILDVEVITEDELPHVGSVAQEVDIPVSNKYIAETEDKVTFVSQYTFENFVVGKSNDYAEAVARAVADNPSGKYNPVFLWGGVGLGKTHLMHAIGNSLQRNFPEKNIMYVTCEQFVNEFIESIADNKSNPNAMRNFRTKYRKLDVFMMDDVQFLANKEGAQEEIFNTFNELYLADKQIILSSDRPPKEINIAERLKTRFATGVIADIKPPDLETRIAILQKKCNSKGYNLTIKVLSLIAEKITNNIREMEGMLNRIISYSTLVGGDPNDMDIVADALRDYADASNDIITLDHIVKATCEYFNVKKDDLVGKKKSKEIVIPRQICIYLICDILGTSVPLVKIGEFFGGRDHTTIMHARDKISEECKTNDVTAAQVKDIRDKIYNR
ncbi:MAG: chromosomal replication initiator protein DnaA [Clostridiales bacterium]|nr:chromosomal replication initiator protein DnaA [Clostridiales bacterium]